MQTGHYVMEWAPLLSFVLLLMMTVLARRFVRGRVGYHASLLTLSLAAWTCFIYLEYSAEGLLERNGLPGSGGIEQSLPPGLLEPQRIYLAVRTFSFLTGLALFSTIAALAGFVGSFAPRPRFPVWILRTGTGLLIVVGLLSICGMRFSLEGRHIVRQPTPIYFLQGGVFATMSITLLIYLLHKSTVMRSLRRRVQALFFSAALLAAFLLSTVTGYTFPTVKSVLVITTLGPVAFFLVVLPGILLSNHLTLRLKNATAPTIPFRPLFTLLQTRYGLTYREAEICCLVESGLGRQEIAARLGITGGVLKLHLHSIYIKCFGKEDRTREKYQKLTVFLHRRARGSV